MTGPQHVRWSDWVTAAQRYAPNDGARATANAWAKHCWDWDSSLTEQQVLARVRPLSLEDFTAAHRPDKKPRTVRRHFTMLVDVGLLELVRGHSRYCPNVYRPRVPQQRPSVAGVADAQRPFVAGAGSEHRPPIAGVGAQQGPRMAPTQATRDIAPIPTEELEPPLPRARTHTPAREGGGGPLDDENDAGVRVVRAVLDKMGDRARKVAPGFRATCVTIARGLLAAGWSESTIVRDVLKLDVPGDSWWDARDVGRVLVSRFRDESKLEPPAAAPVRVPWCGECDSEQSRTVTHDDDTVERCPRCHPHLVGMLELAGV